MASLKTISNVGRLTKNKFEKRRQKCTGATRWRQGRGMWPAARTGRVSGSEHFYRRSLHRISKQRRGWLRPLLTPAQAPCHPPTSSGTGDFPLSLPGHRIVTTSGYSHYRSIKFSLPVAVLTTRFLSVMFTHFYCSPG